MSCTNLYHRFPVVVTILFLLFPAESRPQIDSTSRRSLFLSDARQAVEHAGTIFTAPLRFDSGDWLATGVILGGTVLLFTVDEPARTFAQRNRSSLGDRVFEFPRDYGAQEYAILFCAGMYTGGLAFEHTPTRRTGLMLLESITFAGVLTNVMKTLGGRSRPFEEDGAYFYRPWQFSTPFTSLPSGHATVAFALSSVLAGRIGNTYASIGLYTLATATAFSRVYHDAHWASDAFLGAAIGTVIGQAVLHLHNEKSPLNGLRITPGIGSVRAKLIF